MKLETRLRLRIAFVIAFRILVGAIFIISGWAKAVDPWGFTLKVSEYLAVWQWNFSSETILIGCVALSAIEFATGILLATGCLKRVAVWGAGAMMLFMLPLTLYIAVADPVADCGCFGDLFIISNWATFGKNVIISALIIYLAIYNRTVRGVYPPAIQWLVITVSLAYPAFLSFTGYQIQPVADFRPFKLGTDIFHPSQNGEEEPAEFIYEKNGERQAFTLDNLPDESWTFVGTNIAEQGGADIAVRDDEGEDVSYDIVDSVADQAWLIIANPEEQFLSRTHFVSRMYRYLNDRGIGMTAIIGSRGVAFDEWIDLTRPSFKVYSAEDTALKQLVRGNAAIVYTRAGKILWKTNLASLPDDMLDRTDIPNVFADVKSADSGSLALKSALIYLATLAVLYLLSLSPKLLRLLTPPGQLEA